MRPVIRRTGRIIGGTVAAMAVGWIGYAAATWLRYGQRRPKDNPDTLLDRYLPNFDVQEVHEIRVAAPADFTFESLMTLDILQSPIVRAIFRGRELMLRADSKNDVDGASLLEQTQALGWRVLAEESGREIVMGAVTQPWESTPVFRSLSPAEFIAFKEPGYVKIAWTLVAEPIDSGRSVARTETRVSTTDAVARRRFRRYWSVFSPGVLLIRKESLRLVRRDAEHNYRTTRRVDTALTAP